MNRYRVALPASIYISVDAESPDDALKTARGLDVWFDSISLDTDDRYADARLYCDKGLGEPTIEDDAGPLEDGDAVRS